MKEPTLENYLTKSEPTIDDWLALDPELLVPLVDADVHALERGMTTQELLEELRQKVAVRGGMALKLAHVEMDGSTHIVFAEEAEQLG